MSEKVLCESDMSVRVDGHGDRTLVVVKDGVVARFWADTLEIEGVLAGYPLQLSAHEGSCLFQLDGEQIRVVFSVVGSGSKSCTFPATFFARTLASIREAGDAEDVPPSPPFRPR